MASRPSHPDLEALQALAARYGVKPSARLGQHFLFDTSVVADAVAAAALRPGERVVEIGAGFGVLTEALLNAGASVTACELDHDLARATAERLGGNERLRLVERDGLGWLKGADERGELGAYSIVSNLPYNISSKFFETVFLLRHVPRRVVVLVQREVAERAAAHPGDTGVLSLVVQSCSSARIVRTVPPTAFWPKPAVQSALLALSDIRPLTETDERLFAFAKKAFATRRQTIARSLSRSLGVPKADVVAALFDLGRPETARPQELSLAEWKALSSRFA